MSNSSSPSTSPTSASPTYNGLLLPLSASTSGGTDGLLTPTTAATSVSGGSEKDEEATTTPTPTPTGGTGTPTPFLTPPPPLTNPYTPTTALTDLPAMAYALSLFLSSQMLESEAYCLSSDPSMERLYFATGYGLIQCVKGLMSYEDEDLLAGIGHTKQGNIVAQAHRKKATVLGSRLAGYVVASLPVPGTGTGGVGWIKGMTDVERHAELVYAESLFEKAMLGIVYSGDWLAFIKEALNMRTTITIYRQLGAYIDHMDAAYTSAHPTSAIKEDPSIDAHFRSGVYLGVGMCNIVLSMMPGKLATLVELFGYKGDRKLGLEMLMRAGGWVDGQDEPKVGAADEGVRRTICDMSLLIFHLVLSSFTFDGVDISVATKVLKWNLKRYPNGVFFLFGAGRLCLCRSQPRQAIHYYTLAMESQKQYRNLHHISFWEIAIANLALWDVRASLECWRDLEREATWSKAIYSYGHAVCLLELAGTDNDPVKKEEAAKLMDKVPSLRQKIAGKSIPLEKFVARKARKFALQGRRLALPALEMAYLFLGITHAPRSVIVNKMLPEVDGLLSRLDGAEYRESEAGGGKGKGKWKSDKDIERAYGGGKGGYWDDYCLAMFLRGVCLRYLAYPDPDADLSEESQSDLSSTGITKESAETQAEASFKAVFEHGSKIELDHHLVYHAHYELGRLYASQSNTAAAKTQFDLVLSGKPLEVGPSGRKGGGRYSMENALHMKTHSALEALGRKRL